MRECMLNEKRKEKKERINKAHTNSCGQERVIHRVEISRKNDAKTSNKSINSTQITAQLVCDNNKDRKRNQIKQTNKTNKKQRIFGGK